MNRWSWERIPELPRPGAFITIRDIMALGNTFFIFLFLLYGVRASGHIRIEVDCACISVSLPHLRLTATRVSYRMFGGICQPRGKT